MEFTGRLRKKLEMKEIWVHPRTPVRAVLQDGDRTWAFGFPEMNKVLFFNIGEKVVPSTVTVTDRDVNDLSDPTEMWKVLADIANRAKLKRGE
jgi:hypothetical protein